MHPESIDKAKGQGYNVIREYDYAVLKREGLCRVKAAVILV